MILKGMETDAPPMTDNEKALVQASVDGDAAKVRELLAAGAKVNVRNAETYPIGYEWNTTPLMFAAANGHMDVVRVLLEGGADVSAASEKHKVDGGGGNQAIHHAVRNNHVEVAKVLLDAGADPNAQGNHGYTPLIWAIGEMNVAAVRLILERGGQANLKIKRNGYEPPLYCATGTICNTTTMVARNGKLVMAVLEKWERKEEVLEIFRLLIAAGADPNAPGGRKNVALTGLVLREEMPDDIRFPIVEMLMNAGARADVENKDGWSPLRFAKERFNNPRMIELLSRPAFVLPSAEPPAKTPVARSKAPKSIKPSAGAADFLQFIADGEPQWAMAALKAPVELVGNALVKFLKSGILRREVAVKLAKGGMDQVAHAIAIVSLTSSPWTIVTLSLFHVNEALINQSIEVAKSLSSQLRTQAIALISADEGAGIVSFDNGKPDSSDIQSVVDDEVDDFMRERGIYLPACYPMSDAKSAWLAVEKSSAKRVERADLIVL